jgi:hypothetical protein
MGTKSNSTFSALPGPLINQNVLGRTGWLVRVRLGLIHHDNMIYFAPYDTA